MMIIIKMIIIIIDAQGIFICRSFIFNNIHKSQIYILENSKLIQIMMSQTELP